MTKLTNEELVTLSNPAISAEVKNFLAVQKMTPEEIRVCQHCGTKPFEYAITTSLEN